MPGPNYPIETDFLGKFKRVLDRLTALEARSRIPPIALTAPSGANIAAPDHGFTLFTAAVLADLGTPVAGAAGWGFTQDGNIYFYPIGGPWGLKV